ncbi:MAG: alpha/beta hydrolase [Solirubrobacteraceae bacterium]
MSELVHRERPAARAPAGLLVLHHGRGSDELDLLGLADVLDPERRLHVVTPRAPLSLPGAPGHHWYLVPRVGHPDPATFEGARRLLAELHDELWRRTRLGPAQTVLGGFSMGCVMSYALGLSGDRPAPAGILALSGFMPAVPGWSASLADRTGTRAWIAHGAADPVIAVSLGRDARQLLQAGGLPVEYHESQLGHAIDRAQLPRAASWLRSTLGE